MGGPHYSHAAKQEMMRLLLNGGQPFTRDKAAQIVSRIELAMIEAYRMGKNETASLGRLPSAQAETWDATGTPGNRGRDDWGSKRGF